MVLAGERQAVCAKRQESGRRAAGGVPNGRKGRYEREGRGGRKWEGRGREKKRRKVRCIDKGGCFLWHIQGGG